MNEAQFWSFVTMFAVVCFMLGMISSRLKIIITELRKLNNNKRG